MSSKLNKLIKSKVNENYQFVKSICDRKRKRKNFAKLKYYHENLSPKSMTPQEWATLQEAKHPKPNKT